MMRPATIIFFANGNTAVCDQNGKQMPRYQEGDHQTAIRLLHEDGIDWRDIPERLGSPLSPTPEARP